MNISQIIINDIAIQPFTQKIGRLKEMFNELTCSHIPVEQNGTYIGSIAENDIRCFEEENTLKEYQYALMPFYIRPENPLLEILKTFANNDTNLLPVLRKEDNKYMGYVELNDIMTILDKTPFFGEEGNIIVVEKKQNDFSFSEISQIVESNEGKLFGAYLNKLTENKAQITIKINNSSLNEILQTFRRYDYEVISEHQEDRFLRDLEERSAYLNKYLNI